MRTPWEIGPERADQFSDVSGMVVIQSSRHRGLVAYVSTEATARRIVACCAAFEEVPTEVIEAFNRNPELRKEDIVADLMSRKVKPS